MSNRVARTVITVAVLAVILLFFYKYFVPEKLVYQGDLSSSDVTELNWPRRVILSESLKKGSIPFWTDRIGSGYPLYAEGQTGVLYPLNLLLFGLLDPVMAYNLAVILTFIMGISFAYLFARSLRRSRPASLFAGFAFGLSAFFITRIKFMSMINAAVWLPLALLGIEKLHQTRKVRWAVLAGASMAMQILAGQTQIFYITALAVISYFLFKFIPDIWKEFKKNRKAAAATLGIITAFFILILAVSFALPAVQLVSSIEAVGSSNRSGGLTFEQATIFSMRPGSLIMFILPYRFGNPALGTYSDSSTIFWESCAFTGVITLILSVIGFAARLRKDGEVWFWLSAAVLSIFIALGSTTPVFHLLWNVLPGIRLFRFPDRFMLVTILSLSMLASCGLDASVRYLKKKEGLFSAFGSSVGVLSIGILIIELFIFAFTQIATIDARELEKPTGTAALVKDDSSPRIAHIGQLDTWHWVYEYAEGWYKETWPYVNYRAMLQPDFNVILDVPDYEAQGDYGVKTSKRLWKYARNISMGSNGKVIIPESVVRMFGTQNVGYVLSGYEISSEYLLPVARYNIVPGERPIDVIVYRNTLKQPRAHFVGGYEVMEDPEAQPLSEIFDAGFDLSNTVLLEQKPSFLSDNEAKGKAEITKSGEEEVIVKVEADRAGMLVLADTYFPGWKATIDGEPAKIFRANYSLRAVEVPEGRHLVRFTYNESGFMPGLAITIATLLLITLGFAVPPVLKRIRSTTSDKVTSQ